MKAFIGQGNSGGPKAKAAAQEAVSMALSANAPRSLSGGFDVSGEGPGGEGQAEPKQRLRGQTQKEQKVQHCVAPRDGDRERETAHALPVDARLHMP